LVEFFDILENEKVYTEEELFQLRCDVFGKRAKLGIDKLQRSLRPYIPAMAEIEAEERTRPDPPVSSTVSSRVPRSVSKRENKRRCKMSK
jgi:hypothetical protein